MENQIYYSQKLETSLDMMFDIVEEKRNEYATPEHFLMSLCHQMQFRKAIKDCGGKMIRLMNNIQAYLNILDKIPEGEDTTNAISAQLKQMLEMASTSAINAAKNIIEVPHVIKALLELPESHASYLLLNEVDGDEATLMCNIVDNYNTADSYLMQDDFMDDDWLESEELPDNDGMQWKRFVVCMNDNTEQRNPLVGRETELENTIRVLCRKDKNNVLHIGEPGVGKTALVYGLAALINKGDVPDSLKDSKIYQLEIGTLLAGTQFRGDFEKRLKLIMDGISREENPIIYIDEIHGLVGAGATGEGAMDASNMLKPYLETGKIRFIGSTTYDEYKRHFAKSKGLVRRFRQIDIPEPSIQETISIISKLKGNYENFHGVILPDKTIEFAVTSAARHLSDRFLPDKAIDLIDEAGAYRRIHPLPSGEQTVDVDLIAEVLSKICKVDSISIKEDDTSRLESLEPRILSKIFGQDKAVKSVTEAVQMSKAGLTEDSKPLASLLFVGPTGVGKTEVARVLAQELGIELIRFDMSEFAEKHAVAKLIGSPAGYVGYEDGGQLTDAIRKSPNCVLLLDEIEKAHPDIYNILLQVMDYARLTDNKGNHADFRNVILIMTSNAGAQYASQAKVGFGNTTSSGEAMMRQVKRSFKPEFINRLSATIVFNDMTRDMASRILDKKLDMLRRQLSNKNVELILSDEAHQYLLSEGFTPEYGAREIDRVITNRLKPILMREILFGELREGGKAEIILSDNGLMMKQNIK